MGLVTNQLLLQLIDYMKIRLKVKKCTDDKGKGEKQNDEKSGTDHRQSDR